MKLIVHFITTCSVIIMIIRMGIKLIILHVVLL